MNTKITYTPNFKQISLNPKEIQRTEKLISSYLKSSGNNQNINNQFYQLFLPFLKKQANEKCNGSTVSVEDFFQKLCLGLFEKLKTFIEQKSGDANSLCEYLNSIKPDCNDRLLVDNRGVTSFDEKLTKDNTSTFIDVTSPKDISEPFSQKNSEERQFEKNQLNQVITMDGILSTKEKEVMNIRAAGATFAEISEKLQRSKSRVVSDFYTSLLKIQSETGTLPEKFNNFVNEFMTVFELDASYEEKVKKAVIKCKDLLAMDVLKLKRNVDKIVNDFKDCDLKYIDYVKAGILRPSLLYEYPETIESNVFGVVEKFKNEGLTLKQYVQACRRQSQLFYQSPDTIESNVRGVTGIFQNEGLTVKDYLLKACVSQPQLFYQLPETIVSNVCGIPEKFKNEGLTVKNYLPICLMRPQLFFMTPEAISEHANVYMYSFEIYNKNKNFMDIIRHKDLTYSTLRLCVNEIIYPQVKKIIYGLSKKKQGEIKGKIVEYFKNNPNEVITIKIADAPFKDTFIKTVDDYFMKEVGRKVFKYEIIEK